MASDTFSFEIVSPKYGLFTVVAPLSLKHSILALQWHVARNTKRAKGRDFMVVTKAPIANWIAGKRRQRTVYLHRFIWEESGRRPVVCIDHIDGQPMNNADDNLRDGTARNQQNCKDIRRDNKSGFVGVCRDKGRWVAQIRSGKQNFHLGYFDDKNEAARVRDAAAIRLHGEFAVLNFPDEHAVTSIRAA